MSAAAPAAAAVSFDLPQSGWQATATEPAEEGDEVRIHFRGGSTALAFVALSDLREHGVDSIESLIQTITDHRAPKWFWFGNVYIFNHAVSGFEIAEED